MTIESLPRLQELAKSRVFSISLLPEGKFEIQEGCDNYFGTWLTQAEMMELADEIKAVALGAIPPEPTY